MTAWLILTRAVHFGACLLFFGIIAFDYFVVSIIKTPQSEIASYWKARLHLFSLVLLPVILVSGIAWFLLVAVTMSGQPLQLDTLKIVWKQTQFGTLWKIRLLLLVTSALVTALFRIWQSPAKKVAAFFQLLVNGCLLGSLAWAGHGRETSPWHLFADILHLLGAGFWPFGLLPLFLLLRTSRKIIGPVDWQSIAALVRRFSTLSLGAVSLMAITGFVNAWFLVGSVSNLFSQTYGRWLLVKIIFFCLALAIASVNLLRLKPQLSNESAQPEKARVTASQLQANIQIELFFGLAIIIIVAILGILPPATH